MLINVIQMFFHHKRDLILRHQFWHCPCIHICPVQYSHFRIRYTFFPVFANPFQHIFRFLHRIFYFLNMNCLIWFPECLYLFFKPDFIISDHTQSASYNISAAAIIDIQKDLSGLWIILHKFLHDSRLCPSESIHWLIIIPYHKQIVLRRRQHPYHIILCLIHILKFIYKNILKFFLPFFQDIRPFHKKISALYQHILKINFTIFLFCLLIGSVQFAEFLCRIFHRLIFFNIHTVIFYISYLDRQFLQIIFFFICLRFLIPVNSG